VRLEKLRTVQWRNLEDRQIEFSPGVNVLVGGNGQGKTNLLEAVHYLALGRSHRGARDDEIVSFGGDHFFVRGDGEGDAGQSFCIEAGFTPPRSKKLKVDGRPLTRLTDLTGVLACVSFGPEDADLPRGAPQLRRRYLDYTLAETSPRSLAVLAEYRRALEQRGALLRDAERPGAGLEVALQVWDEELVRHGCELVVRRAEALADLGERAREVCARLGGAALRLRYAVHALGAKLEVGQELVSFVERAGSGELEASFRRRLAERRAAERVRRLNLVGPHRDDLELELDGLELRRYGSQGQCRLVAVALKMAQAEFIRERRRERPVVLLDDVFAELDEERAGRLWETVCQRHQTLLAVPRRSDLGFGAGDALFRVEGGRLTREG
jgi:DNA replication and repair protein RecF